MTAVLAMPGRRDVEAGLGRALLLALIVEGALLAALVLLMTRMTSPLPPPAPPVQIALIAPPAPKPPAPPKPVVKPIPRPVPKKVVVPRPVPPKPQPHVVVPKPQPLPPSPVAAPTPPPPPAPSRPTSPPPPPPAPNPQVKDSYLGRVKAAIQAAVRYPAAARMMGESGRVKVTFMLRNGVAEDVRVTVPGITAAFNDAALAAVRAAAIPAPPASLAGKNMGLTVWVEFNLHEDY